LKAAKLSMSSRRAIEVWKKDVKLKRLSRHMKWLRQLAELLRRNFKRGRDTLAEAFGSGRGRPGERLDVSAVKNLYAGAPTR
jgi:hypothetical protein